ncbi:phage portal protein [Pseudophaeobacter sp.]|uniref:phage portal protein n=1 Tax=Pseudophaeobacter sp. TaxID=1971739 RepID=UPI003298B7F6
MASLWVALLSSVMLALGGALQVLDPLRCPVSLDKDKLPGGHFIRAGIEYSKLGRPVAYCFTTLSPNEADYHHSGRGFPSLLNLAYTSYRLCHCKRCGSWGF